MEKESEKNEIECSRVEAQLVKVNQQYDEHIELVQGTNSRIQVWFTGLPSLGIYLILTII